MLTKIMIPFNWKIIIFLIIIEVFTIPFVALGNQIILTSHLYMAGMGFIIAFFALIAAMKLIIIPLKKYFSKLIASEITQINGVFYLGLISGFLLMFMFYIQELTYQFTRSDYIVGLVSAFFSVSISLIIYTIIQRVFNYGVIIETNGNRYVLQFPIKDIIVLTLLFSLYETIASPVSILWLPHYEHRFIWGIISGILSGVGGGLPMVIICYFTKYKITINLKKLM